MQKIKNLLPLILFIIIVLFWSIFRESKLNTAFSYSIVNSVNLLIDSKNYDEIFKKYKKGYGEGEIVLSHDSIIQSNIRLGGESSKDTFYQTQKIEAATLHIDLKHGASGKISSLFGDNTYSREHLAYLVFEEFFEVVPENNFIKMSLNNGPYNLFLMVENINSHFFNRRKMQKLYIKTSGQDIRFLINNKSYELLIEKFDNQALFKYLLYAYLIDDQDGPFSARGYTENATLIKDKFFHKYFLIPNDLDQTFQCNNNDLYNPVFEFASFLLKNSKEKEALDRILISTKNKIFNNNLLEELENGIHEKLNDCCNEFLNNEYFTARADLLLKIDCVKNRYSYFLNELQKI